MGKWVAVTKVVNSEILSFDQWQPTEKGESVPDYDPWDGCPICGANPLPRKDVATPAYERLRLNHDIKEHNAWVEKFRTGFQEDVSSTMDRMEPPVEPEKFA